MTLNSNFKEKLKTKGIKMTKQREVILDIFMANSGYLMTAHSLYQQVAAKLPSTNFSTVYRNIGRLVQEGILSRVTVRDRMQTYELNSDVKHHHHMICKTCGSIKCTAYCPFDNLSDIEDFKPTEHNFEIYGYCSECLKHKSDLDF